MEDKMIALKSLTFTMMPSLDVNPTLDRRQKIIARLEEQRKLAANPNFTRTIRQRVEKDGVKTLVEKQQKVQPWWRAAPNGSLAFGIRAGAKLVEFDKGKTAIVVPSLEKLPAVIDTLIAAIRNGELDVQLEAAATKPAAKEGKKAAGKVAAGPS
jgi:hypothetical protein